MLTLLEIICVAALSTAAEAPSDEFFLCRAVSTATFAQEVDPQSAERDEEKTREVERAKRRAEALVWIGAAGPNGWLKREWRFDLNLDLAVGGPGAASRRFFGRTRVGVTRVAEPGYYTLGLTADLVSEADPAFGLQFEAMEMVASFQWQVGAMVDTGSVPCLTTALGWQIFALEGQLRFDEETSALLYFKVRLPVSWLLHIFFESRR